MPGTKFMKVKCLLAAMSALYLAGRVVLAAPANDNFTNRIVLAGNDIVFSGTLAGATRETNQSEVRLPIALPYFYMPPRVQTIWWDWTATQPGTVTIQVLNAPANCTNGTDAIGVFSLQNISTGQFLAGRGIESRFPQNFFSFEAEVGNSYQIQLAGSDGASFDLRLVSSGPPLLLQPPQPQTVSMGDSVLFTVVAAGAKPMTYQWQRHGTNIPGETVAMLAFTNVTGALVDNYSVVVSNAGGTTISAPVNLQVTAGDTTTLLAAPSEACYALSEPKNPRQ